MSEQTVFVFVDLQNKPILVGRLYVHLQRGKERASFAYDPDWLQNPYRFALEPALTLYQGKYHTRSGKALFGSIGDSAPDRWGRILLRRYAGQQAKQEGKSAPTLFEVDYLLGVDDTLRQGALRFKRDLDGPFLQSAARIIPPLVDLPRLMNIAKQVSIEEETYEDLKLLLAPGSSLGGTRPKASVMSSDGELMIAKLSHPNDEVDLPKWETLALRLAQKAGIIVAPFQLENIHGHSVLLVKRFDRRKRERIHYLSAMSMLEAEDHEEHSYIEIAEAIRRYGKYPIADLEQLWRRIAFTILISNTDDHLRNHGFLLEDAQGWELSPAFDMNPTSPDIRPRFLTTAINMHDTEASIETLLSVSEYFGLSQEKAKQILYKVACVTQQWREEARALKLSKSEIEKMSGAFEHKDLQVALKIS